MFVMRVGLVLILSCSRYDTEKDRWTERIMPGYGCHLGTELGWADGSAAGLACDAHAPAGSPDVTESESEFCTSELPSDPNPETSFVNFCNSIVESSARECYISAYIAAFYQSAPEDCDVCLGAG